jgi:Flp pilus assembly protein TadB
MKGDKKMKDKNSRSGSYITIGDLLLITFTVLKLCGVINWSWVWVLSPLWIGLILLTIVIVIEIILARK